MAGLAPFGRNDQPLIDVKIVGGKRVEIEVDKYEKNPLNQAKRTDHPGTNFQTQQHRGNSSVLSSARSVNLQLNLFLHGSTEVIHLRESF